MKFKRVFACALTLVLLMSLATIAMAASRLEINDFTNSLVTEYGSFGADVTMTGGALKVSNLVNADTGGVWVKLNLDGNRLKDFTHMFFSFSFESDPGDKADVKFYINDAPFTALPDPAVYPLMSEVEYKFYDYKQEHWGSNLAPNTDAIENATEVYIALCITGWDGWDGGNSFSLKSVEFSTWYYAPTSETTWNGSGDIVWNIDIDAAAGALYRLFLVETQTGEWRDDGYMDSSDYSVSTGGGITTVTIKESYLKTLTFKDGYRYAFQASFENNGFAWLDLLLTVSGQQTIKIGDYEGESARITDDETLEWKIDEDIMNFLELQRNWIKVDEGNYALDSGSTIITVNSGYLASLDVGEHTFAARFDGDDYMLTIIVSKEETTNTSPGNIGDGDTGSTAAGSTKAKDKDLDDHYPTGDGDGTAGNAALVWIAALSGFAALGAAGYIIRKRTSAG